MEASAPEADEKFAEMLEGDPHRKYYFMSRAVTVHDWLDVVLVS